MVVESSAYPSRLDHEEVDLRELMLSVAARAKASSSARLLVDAARRSPVLGNQERLTLLFENLLDEAVARGLAGRGERSIVASRG